MNIRFSRPPLAVSPAPRGAGPGRTGQPRQRLAFGAAVLATAGLLTLAGCGSLAASGSGSASGTGSGGTADGSAAPAAAATASAPAKPAPAQAALCAQAAEVTRLVVVRSRTINRIQIMHFPFPSQVLVTDAAHARAVAAALCALPKMPSGPVNCPNLILGTSYRLTFTVAGRPLPMVTVQATGCQSVTGLGPVRRVTQPAFWRVLGTAIGLFGAGPPVFSGHGPDLPQCQSAATHSVPMAGCPGTMRPLATPGPVT